jgi:hypothetical protein
MLLIGASLLWPWLGWQGLRTAAPAFSFVAVVAAWSAINRRRRLLAVLTVAAAGTGTALYLARLLEHQPNVILQLWQSRAGLVLGLVGSVVLVAVGALSLIVDGRQPDPVQRAWPLDASATTSIVWRAVWSSRLLVWTAGILGVLKIGIDPSIGTPSRIVMPFGYLGNLLSAPASAWDATAYLSISQYGYGHSPSLLAFFPVYPTLLRVAAFSAQADLIWAVLISVAAFAAALFLMAKLVELECDIEVSHLTVLVVAFSPMALFFSAVYTESLFLLLSVASFYSARRGWWLRAGVCGALAAATRSTGVVLLLPLLIMYLWGPRGDRPAAAQPQRHQLLRRPRFPVQLDLLWLLLVPLGAAAYFAYAGVNGDLLGPLHAQQTYWHRSFTPLLGAFRGIWDAARSLHQLIVGPGRDVLPVPSFQMGGALSSPVKLAGADLTDFAFLVFGCIATIGACRRLPAAYGAYAVGMIALTVSSYTPFEPLASFPRYLLVVFPCQIWLALWARRASRRTVVLMVNAGLLAFFASQFSTWRWVA